MNGKGMLRYAMIAVCCTVMGLPFLTRVPIAIGGTAFTQQELDQMLAPIALYPDALLAQVLVAATYPIEVVQADRWVKNNKNLRGDQLNAAMDKQSWDLSVKALVPFPQVLAMMSDKLDWTQRLGDAFLAQQADVMDTVQALRRKAKAQGNLAATSQQKVIVQDQVVVIEPADPQVVYVPYYNPAVVYGTWWYPAYPPFYYYPPGAVIAAGAIGFAAGVAVASAWNWGWGHWDWGHHDINVNVNRNVNINRQDLRRTDIQTQSWQHDPSHRQAVPYRDDDARRKYGAGGAGTPDSRGDFRGYSRDGQDGRPQGLDRPGAGDRPSGRAQDLPGMGGSGRPTADDAMRGLQQRDAGHAFSDFGRGSDVRTQSDRGFASRSGGLGEMGGGGFGGGGFRGGGGARGGGRR